MNIKLITTTFILSLCLIFGFEETSYSLNKASPNNIAELEILKYLPKHNKTLFISNSKSTKIISDIKKIYKTKDRDDLILIKNSILAYLGINLGTNKLEDIYNNEITITTYDNKEQNIDDILIVFKIKEKKDIDDILNLTNKIDEPNKLIKIFRENKLNYLNYIYRTNDNYILTSSSKTLLLDALKSRNINNKEASQIIYFRELLKNFKNENNILFTKDLKANKILNNQNYLSSKDDYIVTLFNKEDKNIILKSYLINNKKNIDTSSYQNIIKETILDKNNYQIIIYNDFLNSINYFNLNSFEKAFLKELNEKLKQNLLLLVSDNNWLIIFDKNNINNTSLVDTKILKDFNHYSIDNNNFVYTIFTKNILTKEEEIVKEDIYNKIFSAESDKLTFVSNRLINDVEINLVLTEFLDYQKKSYTNYFLDKKIILKNPHHIEYPNTSYLQDMNYFLKDNIYIYPTKFKAIIRQSIPELMPIYYSETNLEIS